jgi:hypothetical protein
MFNNHFSQQPESIHPSFHQNILEDVTANGVVETSYDFQLGSSFSDFPDANLDKIEIDTSDPLQGNLDNLHASNQALTLPQLLQNLRSDGFEDKIRDLDCSQPYITSPQRSTTIEDRVRHTQNNAALQRINERLRTQNSRHRARMERIAQLIGQAERVLEQDMIDPEISSSRHERIIDLLQILAEAQTQLE